MGAGEGLAAPEGLIRPKELKWRTKWLITWRKKRRTMRIAMIGSGYVGLVSGACFADFGHRVTCVDKNASKIASLVRGEMPIYERDLEGLVARNLSEGRLTFTTELANAVRGAEAVFIAVGTPSRRGDGHAD